MAVIRVAPVERYGELPPELSWGFHFHFHKLVKKPFHFVKHSVKVVGHHAKHYVKVAKHHKKLLIGAALIGAGAYAYHAGWLGKTGIGKTLAGHKIGHALGKTASAVHKISLLHTAKKLLHETGHFLTSPAVLTAAAIATGSKICTGDKCYGIEPVQTYPQGSPPYSSYYADYYPTNASAYTPDASSYSDYYADYYPANAFADNSNSPVTPLFPKPAGSSRLQKRTSQPQKGSSRPLEAGAGEFLSFLKNPYILAGLAVGTLIVLSRRK